jgi:hypothetical protein
MVTDREFAEAFAEYVHAVDRLRAIDAKQRDANAYRRRDMRDARTLND